MADRDGDNGPAGDGARARAEPSRRLGPRSWWAALKGVVRRFRHEDLGDAAAALTYQGLLAIFPALIVLVSLLGLLGRHPETTNALLDIVGRFGSDSAVATVRDPIERVVRDGGGAGALFGLGLVGALWSASGYIGAFGRAANRIWQVEEGRSFWKWRPLQVVIALALLVMVALIAIGLVVSGPLAEAIGDAVGAGSLAEDLWALGRWPVMLLLAITVVALLFRVTPNVRRPGARLLSPGAAAAILLWIVASALLALYIANFGNYDATYGSLAGVIVLLLWMWLTNVALLLGVLLDAELERQREIAAGRPDATEKIQLAPRSPAGAAVGGDRVASRE